MINKMKSARNPHNKRWPHFLRRFVLSCCKSATYNFTAERRQEKPDVAQQCFQFAKAGERTATWERSGRHWKEEDFKNRDLTWHFRSEEGVNLPTWNLLCIISAFSKKNYQASLHMLVHVSQKSKYPWDQNGSIQCTPLHSGRAQKRHTPVPLKSVSVTLQEQRVQLAIGAAGNSKDSVP